MLDMFDMFSNLQDRADVDASVLSGGERQMLTMCRTLMGDPQIIMIDEPTEGLAPKIVQQVGELLERIAERDMKSALPAKLSHNLMRSSILLSHISQKSLVKSKGSKLTMEMVWTPDIKYVKTPRVRPSWRRPRRRTSP